MSDNDEGYLPADVEQVSSSELEELRKYRTKYEEIRSSKAYRLGSLIAENSTTPIRLIKLPIKIWVEFAKPHFFPTKAKVATVFELQTNRAHPTKGEKRSQRDWELGSHAAISGKRLEELNILCIADEFTFSAIQPESNFIQAEPNQGFVQIDDRDPDLFFVESAWKGKNGLWERKVSNPSEELRSILQECNLRGVPTVFWNKEDPVHFETFLSTAHYFDYVFTTDVDKVPDYKRHLGHSRVFWLPFGFQPKLFNPISDQERRSAIFFAGAYYQRYEERKKQLEDFFSELPKIVPTDIFDRNLGTDDERYKFPPQFEQHIRGTLSIDEVAQTSKKYKYALNLNSVKQSQTMFARRIFESVASGNIVLSNFSRGSSNLFGDIIISSDSGKFLANKLQAIEGSNGASLNIVLGLRKVFRQYTSKKQLERMLNHLDPLWTAPEEELITVFSKIQNSQDAESAIANFRSQEWKHKQLVLITSDSHAPSIELPKSAGNFSVRMMQQSQLDSLFYKRTPQGIYAFFDTRNSYGSNFLTDLMIAFQFSEKQAVTKSSFYDFQEGQLVQIGKGTDYSNVHETRLDATLLRISPGQSDFSLQDLVSRPWDEDLPIQATSMDRYSFIRNLDPLRGLDEEVQGVLNPGFNMLTGLSEVDYSSSGEEAPIDVSRGELSFSELNSDSIFSLFRGDDSRPDELSRENTWRSRGITITKNGGNLQIQSPVKDNSHEYIYTREAIRLDSDIQLKTHEGERYLELNMSLVGEISAQGVVRWLAGNNSVISAVLFDPNSNQSIRVPDNSYSFLIGLRVQGQGKAILRKVSFFHKDMTQKNIVGSGKTLIISTGYPSQDNLYRHAFIHSRNRYYRSQGLDVDIFRLNTTAGLLFSEFEGLPILEGNLDTLRDVLTSGAYDSIGVHFLSSDIWSVLDSISEDVPITVWVHGADIEPYWRRPEIEPTREIVEQSDSRFKFWSGLFANLPSLMRVVFVSESLFQQVREDYGIQLPDDQYEVMANPIDTDLFKYSPKPVEQRKAILSIRPFANGMYANDLTVSAILELSQKSFFEDLTFTIVGDGKLFSSTTSPLRKFKNVNLIQGFLTQDEIARLHKTHGIFLVPTRHDTQGVSRDEAMSSGLIPVTSSIPATREFVPEGTGFLGEPENHQDLSAAIEKLYWHPNLFSNMSENAKNEIHEKRSAQKVGNLEIELLRRIHFSK